MTAQLGKIQDAVVRTNAASFSVSDVTSRVIDGANWFGRGVSTFVGKVADYAQGAARCAKTFFVETAAPAATRFCSSAKNWALANPELLKGFVVGAIVAGVATAAVAKLRGGECHKPKVVTA